MQTKQITYEENCCKVHDLVNGMSSTLLQMIRVDDDLATDISFEFAHRITEAFDKADFKGLVKLNLEMVREFSDRILDYDRLDDLSYLIRTKCRLWSRNRHLMDATQYPGGLDLFLGITKAIKVIDFHLEQFN